MRINLEGRDNITANVKKNISKLMNQSQDVEEDENDSDDDNTNPEAYSVQNDGWHIVEKLRMETVQNHLVNLSPYSLYPSLRCRYQVVIISVALALGCDALQHNPAENSHAESERLLLLLWDVLQYSKQSNSPFSVLQTIPKFDTGIVFTVLMELPQYFILHAPLSVAIDTYRIFLITAGPFPQNPFPIACYITLLQRFASLLVYVVHPSVYYSIYTPHDLDSIQIPQTALEEAILLLRILQEHIDEISSIRIVGIDTPFLSKETGYL